MEEKSLDRVQSGWLIFFDGETDGKTNLVGIVYYFENGIIHIVYGHLTDDGKTKIYFMDSHVIYGFGGASYKKTKML